MTIDPIIQSIETKASPERAFDLFTGHMGLWWPRGMTVGSNPYTEIIIEPREGGRWFERDSDGNETEWGKVLIWSPPERLVLAWQIDAEYKYNPNLITEVELSFCLSENGGTLVKLEHRDLERFGSDAMRRALQVNDGWSHMLPLFAECADNME